ncbi:MAG: hypothetical protein K6G90_10075 [Clostridia bacterium]|nr:hypothetical protein [Clostridia bacterium]
MKTSVFRRVGEWLSIQVTKNTSRILLVGILVLNIIFILFSALLISSFGLKGTEHMDFLKAAFCTVTMIMDAGCIQFVVEDIGPDNFRIAVLCLLIIFTGMIIFTGALIGYITNYISMFIERANEGERKLRASDHIVILNWNTRASEIINDLLYRDGKQKVVVLVDSNKDDVHKEISERLADTINRENRAVAEEAKKRGGLAGRIYRLKNRFRMNVTVVVREGDVFSTKQLEDISLKRAKSVIILGGDVNSAVCKFETQERLENLKKGNALTVKTLMQVADITGAEDSNDDQTIIVEITDEWTQELVNKIIRVKEVDGKCNIVPVRVNRVLGQILSQFSLMPELNEVYSELFSNKGAAFYCKPTRHSDAIEFTNEKLGNRFCSIPLTTLSFRGRQFGYFTAAAENQINMKSSLEYEEASVSIRLNPDYAPCQKNIIILGHNNKTRELVEGFVAYMKEWKIGGVKLHITVIDDEKSAGKMAEYEEIIKDEFGDSDCFIAEYFAADIYDRERITTKMRQIIEGNETDTSVLILSDENVLKEDIDSNALTNLVYLQDIIEDKKKNERGFDPESIDVVVEIIDPKHHDVIGNYSTNNVVISNRYISKMITQISEKQELYEFYKDVLTYDTDDSNYDSKEIYLKEADRFFLDSQIPGECTTGQLIRGVWEQSVDPKVFRTQLNPTLVLGYVRPHEGMTLFTGDQNKETVKLQHNDKLIVYSLH